ncbi:MAG TPA: hypothetical protein VF064_11100 [Pyrinomonadaceae bacterium]
MAVQQGRQNVLDSYVTVAERIAAFYQSYPTGRICTQILEHHEESGFILMRAEVFRSTDDAQPSATGHAFEVRGDGYVNRTSYIENAETSAVGRALALLGFEVRRGIASREEMEKAARMPAERAARAPESKPPESKPPEGKPAAKPAPPPAAAESPSAEESPNLDDDIIRNAQQLGYDAAKVRRWVNQKFGVTGGLESLTEHDKREVLKLFREQAQAAQAKSPRK